jgi:hypothetical protein
MSDNVRLVDAEVAQESQAVGRLTGNGQRSDMAAAACETTPVIADQAEVVTEGGFGHQRREGVGYEAPMDEHHRLS